MDLGNMLGHFGMVITHQGLTLYDSGKDWPERYGGVRLPYFFVRIAGFLEAVVGIGVASKEEDNNGKKDDSDSFEADRWEPDFRNLVIEG